MLLLLAVLLYYCQKQWGLRPHFSGPFRWLPPGGGGQEMFVGKVFRDQHGRENICSIAALVAVLQYKYQK